MSKLSKYLIGLAVTALVLFIVWYFSNIVAYLLVSAVLAIIGKPLVDALLRIRVGKFSMLRWLAALLTLVSIWTVTALFFTFFIPLVFDKLNELASFDMGHIVDSFRDPLFSLEMFLKDTFALDAGFSLIEELSTQLPNIFDVGAINRVISSVVSLVAGTAIAVFSISFITFFFLKEDRLFYNMVVMVFPKKYEQNITHALDSITRLLIRYFTGILAESTIVVMLTASILMIFGITGSTALFMGLIMGILNVIPYIGPLMGASICVVIGVVSPMEGATGMQMFYIIAGTILCVEGVDNFVLQPMLYSNRVNAHPLEIFLVILIAGSVAGVLGMLLAIPSYNVIRVFAKEFFNNFRLVQKLTENI